MRIVRLTVAACVLLIAAAVSPAQNAPLLTAEDIQELVTLQKTTVAPIPADRTFLTGLFNRLVDAIMAAPDPAGKIAAREEAIDVMFRGKGVARGNVSDVFRDLSSDVVTAVLAARWDKLDANDWLGRMNVMLVVAALAADTRVVVFTALQQGIADPNLAVRYHAVKGLWPLRSAIVTSAVRAVLQNRDQFLAAVLKQTLAEKNPVMRRLLYRMLLMQKSVGNAQNNVTVGAMLQVAKPRLDLIPQFKQMPGMEPGLFFERADLELTRDLGISLEQEKDKATRTALAQEMARILVFAAEDYGRADLPEHYQLLLTEILLAAEDALLRVVPNAQAQLRNALGQPTLAQRQGAASVAAGINWANGLLVKTFGTQVVLPPKLPPYGQPATTEPPVLPEGPIGPTLPDAPVGPMLP